MQPRPPPTKFLEIPFSSTQTQLPLVELSPGVFILDAFESYWNLFMALDSWVIEHQNLDHPTYEKFITDNIKVPQPLTKQLPEVSSQTYSTILLSEKHDPTPQVKKFPKFPKNNPKKPNPHPHPEPHSNPTQTDTLKRHLNTNSSPRLFQSYPKKNPK